MKKTLDCRLLLIAVLAFLTVGCGGSTGLEQEAGALPGFSLSLPQGKLASDMDLDPLGSAFLMSSDEGVSVDGTAAVLDATELDLAYVIYGTQLPEGLVPSSITVEIADPAVEFWLAFSDYGGTNSWELHGPLTGEVPGPIGLFPGPETAGNYVNAAGYTYWAVIVGRPHAVRVLQSHVLVEAEPVAKRPPAGDYQADSASSFYPDLLLLPEDGWRGAAGAPIIAYTSLADALPELYVAYYDGAVWQRRRVDTERNLQQPQILLTSEGIRVMANEPATGTIFDYLLDNDMGIRATRSVSGITSPPLLKLSADIHDSGTEELPAEEIVVTAAYSGETTSELWFFAWTEAEGWHSAREALVFDDRILGSTVGFSPGAGTLIAAVSHGSINTTDTLLIDSSLTISQRDGTNWFDLSQDIEIQTDNQAPMGLDLGFLEDDTPQLVAVAARDLSIFDFTASLFFDVTVGSPGDETWFFERAFTSSVNVIPVIPPFPPTEAVIELSISQMASWARPNGLIHYMVDGEITMDLATQQPTDGAVDTSTQFRSKPVFAWVADDYYTGSPGIQFSFGDHHVGGGAAYVKASVISIEDLLGGQFALENELRYWAPD